MIELIFILWVAVGTTGFWETVEGIRRIKEFKWVPDWAWSIIAAVVPILWVTLIQIFFHPLNILIFGVIAIVYMDILFSRNKTVWSSIPTLFLQLLLYFTVHSWTLQSGRFWMIFAVEIVAIVLFLLKKSPNWAIIGIGLWVVFKPIFHPEYDQFNDLIDLLGLFIPLFLYVEESARRLRIVFERGHDPLTTLMNRMSFNDWLLEGDDVWGAMILIDLDDFKFANDTFGHQMGDQILQEAGYRIKTNLPTEAKAFRWGGDEFVIVWPGIKDKESALPKIEKLHESFSNESFYADQEMVIQASMGVACGRMNEDLFNKADTALLNAKRSGKNKIGWYQDAEKQLSETGNFSAETHLRWVSDSLRYLMNHSSKGFILTDEAMRIIDVNPTFEEMSGYTKAEMLGKKPNMFASTLHLNQMKYPEMHESLEKVGWWKGHFVNKRPTGEVWRAHHEISTVMVKDKTVGYWALVEQDVLFDMEEEILNAMDRQEFHLYLQPECQADGSIVGAEALIRWLHIDQGFISPIQFIPVAEDKGLIIPIGYWIIHEVCLLAKRLDQNHIDIPLSINISPVQFHDHFFVDHVRQIIEDTGVRTSCLTFEVTERVLLNEEDHAVEKISMLQEMGIQISLDDFGTGYSSLAYLKDLSINQIKIDQTFTRSLTINPSTPVILSSIVQMALDLHLNIVVEGVETSQQLAALEQMGCNVFQGYYFSQPVPAKDFFGALKPNQAPNASMLGMTQDQEVR